MFATQMNDLVSSNALRGLLEAAAAPAASAAATEATPT